MRKILVAAVVVLSLAGCAAPASRQAMSVATTDIAVAPSEKLKANVFVRNVTGGKETNPLWTSQVDSPSFKAALEQSIAAMGYRSDTPSATYRVDADLMSLNQPLFGLTFNVQSTVLYTVSSDAGTSQVPVTATGTATAGDVLYAVERLRIANERSIKENIKAFISRLTDQFGK